MRSVSTKIILWSVSALLVSLAVFIVVSQVVIGDTLMTGLSRYSDFHFQKARQAYQSGGAGALSAYLDELNRSVGVEYHLLDSAGKDLRTGESMEPWIERGQRHWGTQRARQIGFGNWSEDGRYAWLGITTPPFSMTVVFAPFYLLVLATVGALYWLVTAQVAKPLRRIAMVVDRFGRGELSARAAVGSKDEIGNLGHSFNAMAERIQTLLAAERQLLQDVSHELRSPLARLTFEAEMVRRTSDRDASAARLRHEIERLSELVGSLIDMVRVEGDPSAVEMDQVCVNDLLQQIAADCGVEAAEKGCCISLDAPVTIDVRGNAELLHRAFENVVRNAIRYTAPGTSVEIGLRQAGQTVTIGVRDYGPGIPESMVPRIFDPFFRVDPSREETTGGLGLGLSIARRAIRVHHGDITAGNRHPGALLQITLPVARPANG